MTSILGIACSDGIVIGADSSATLSSPQLATIEQQTNKIELVLDSIILAGTGEVGLGQRFREVIKKTFNDGVINQGPIAFCKALSRNGIDDFRSTYVNPGGYGALVGFACKGGAHLCEIGGPTFQPEMKEGIWYASMGSAQTITDPFLGFFRQAFWSKGRPNLSEGIFAATCVLQQAINLNPGGVNGPIRMTILEKSGPGCKARHLNEQELNQHSQHADEFMKYISKFAEKFQPAQALDLPTAPTPPDPKSAPGASAVAGSDKA